MLKNRNAASYMPQDEESLLVLRERALQLAKQKNTPEEKDDITSYIRVCLNKQEFYGIPYSFAKEVILSHGVTSIPHSKSFVAGVINWRGMLLTVINLKKYFNLPDLAIEKYHNILIVNSNNMNVGLLVDSIEGSDFYETHRLQPPLYSKNIIRSDLIIGIDKGRTAIMNIENILADVKKQLEA